MSESPHAITPTPLTPPPSDAPPAAASAARPGGWFGTAGTTRWLALGAGATLATVFLLSSRTPPGPLIATTPPTITTASQPAKPAEPADPILSPAALAAARLDAQNALAAVLVASDALAAQRASEWDAAAWTQAQSGLALGERAYREERYPAAIRHYAATRADLAQLAGRLPGLIAASAAEGQQALARGDAVAATRAFTRVLAASPAQPQATIGLARARHYDQVQALLAEGAGYERLNDPTKARTSYGAALALDPATPLATQGLARLDEDARAESYELAMSQGYAALADARFDAARVAFTKAGQLQPTAEDARRALATTALLASAAKFNAYLTGATRHEHTERWEDAVSALSAAMAIDPDVAALGARREYARGRAALARRLQASLQDPAQLREPASAAAAARLLEDARRTTPSGPKLRAQIQQLGGALKQARESPSEVQR
ncbi:MAG: hypothetical protein EXR83_10635 [Gammaproteobacteria bacterium]|nr:hypothetical protein [Gammaproteobacteria bacterium]